MGSLSDKTIYAIQHNKTKKIYVGCSTNFERRIKEHLSHLSSGSHENSTLQLDYNEYGNDFSFFILEENVEHYKCFCREHEWMCMLKSNEHDTGYNLLKKEAPITLDCFEKLNINLGKIERRKPIVKENQSLAYQRFKKKLEALGVTEYQVSKATGIPTSALTQWSRGDYNLKLDKLTMIANYFNVPVTEFIE